MSDLLKKGTNLELLTAAYFQAHGYLVRRNITLSVAAGTAEATDIDMLAIRFHVPLAEERLIADCKDRKKPRPFERILWTCGLATFAEAHHAVVVIPRAPWQAREFASKGGIEILGVSELEQYLYDNQNSYRTFGEAAPELTSEFDLRKKKVQYLDKDLFKEDLALRQMLVAGHSLTNLNRIIRMLSESTKVFRRTTSPDVIWLRRYLYYNAAVIASIMLTRFAAESKWTPERDWSDHVRKRLTYGDVSPQKARQLAEITFDRNFFHGLPTPHYAEDIVKLIGAFINQPMAASITPYVIDFQLFGRILRERPRDYENPLLIGQEEALRLARRVLSTLSYAADVPSNIWSAEETRAEIKTNAAPNITPPVNLKSVASGHESKTLATHEETKPFHKPNETGSDQGKVTSSGSKQDLESAKKVVSETEKTVDGVENKSEDNAEQHERQEA
jgi:hypothetical protein